MRRKYFLICTLIVLFSIGSQAQMRSEKRGLAYGGNSNADLAVLSSGVSWWYNWYVQPEAAVLSTYSAYTMDYIPMAWGATFDKALMHTFLENHPNVKYILGWNEPNFTTQSNLPPKEAAAHWADIEALANEFNLKIVSPALNYCDQCVSEDGITYTDPVKYLDAFFAACDTCRIDYIAIHTYMGNVSALQWYVGLFKKYGKPIWVTEFANWENNPTLEQQENYLIGAVDYLENDPDVYRYAWFTGRSSGSPYNAILDTPGHLTELGNIFVNTPVHDTTFYIPLPAKIEAEQYATMNGIFLEKTQDASGLADVGYIDFSDWLTYNITTSVQDTFKLSLRAAANYPGKLVIYVDGTQYASVSIPSTGGYQNWTTIEVPTTFVLNGEHKLTLKALTGGFNINWLSLEHLPKKVITGVESEKQSIRLYPNPSHSIFSIDTDYPVESVEVTNAQGIGVLHNRCNHIDLSTLPSGIYFVKVKVAGATTTFHRIIKD